MGSLGTETGALRLSGPLTIRNISALHEVLSKSIAESQHVILDISTDGDVDISFVQLVVSAQIGARVAGRQISLARPADGALLDVLVRGGFLDAEGAGFWTSGEMVQ